MGLHLPPKSTLDGIPVSQLQKALRRHVWVGRSPEDKENPAPLLFSFDQDELREAGDFAQLDLMIQHDMAKLYREDESQHRSGEKTPVYALSPEGEALMGAHLRKRTSLAKADIAFGQLKRGIDQLNEDEIRQVDEVWIYGSYMRREDQVGDIDAAIVTSRPGPYKETLEVIEELHEGEPWHNAAKRRMFGIEEAYEHQIIFDGRKKPIFDGTKMNALELRAGMPVQRIYTKEGGWRAEEILDRHPEAKSPMSKPQVSVTIDQGTFEARNANGAAGQGARNPHLSYNETSAMKADRGDRVRAAALRKANSNENKKSPQARPGRGAEKVL
jgi:predicted nucleotidyltransferase